MFCKVCSNQGQRGATLLEVLIAGGILTVAASLAMTRSSQEEAFQAASKRAGDLEDVRQFIRNNLSCELTLELQSDRCARPGAVEIVAYAEQRRPLFGPPPMLRSVGEHYELHALCGDGVGTDSIRMEYRARQAAAGGRPAAWTRLFDGYDITCPAGKAEKAACDGSDVVINPAATGFFTHKPDIVYFSNSIPGINTIFLEPHAAGSGALASVPSSAQALCCLAGFARGQIVQTKSNTSCGDNVHAFWVADNWQTIPACKYNFYIEELRCAGALKNGWGRRLQAVAYGMEYSP